MTETEFLVLADVTLREIEMAMDNAAAAAGLDIECTLSGNVLEIELVDNGSKIIINSQVPMQEIWVAAKTGGFHFKRQANQWIDTRDGTQLFAALSRVASAQAGCAMTLASV